MTVVEKVELKLVLLVYCAAIVEEVPHKKYLPQTKRFEERMDRVIQYEGSTEVLVTILELMMAVKLTESYRLNLRTDLFELAVRELSGEQETSWADALKVYSENEGSKNPIKNTSISLGAASREMLWRVVFRVDRAEV
jgi:hypothetical protein